MVIVLSSLKLAVDTYIPDKRLTDDEKLAFKISEILDYIFNALFILESLLKIIGFGFVIGKETYLRDEWN